ncbi:uncharacterized protein LOC101848882 isoform X2 [Aplysia californica]|uniref:Uncharacterized protein LOC101848882 isoform X2 n=1 Tax=Aplysia californica TaxID=6500 RepID=A0ABM0JMM3_APLCA|nr:uncharacterized protein LOC101848882 isoform X2 [Aplysia californica]
MAQSTPTTRERGTHEVEENCAEAGGPLSSFIGCTKNRGHPQFIPVYEFSADHVRPYMPGEQQKGVDRMVEIVKVLAEFVVRISAPVVSDQRPDTWEDGRPYPFVDRRGRRTNKVGSGYVTCVTRLCGKSVVGICRRGSCPRGTAEENECWKIQVATARHVVYDDSEARECELVLFDDRPDGSDSVTLTGGWSVESADTEKDMCVLELYTHDKVLGRRLENIWSRRRAALWTFSKREFYLWWTEMFRQLLQDDRLSQLLQDDRFSQLLQDDRPLTVVAG